MKKAKGSNKRTMVPLLVRLKYGTVYCELGKETINAGDLVAWWPIRDERGRSRLTAYCVICHRANERAGKPLR